METHQSLIEELEEFFGSPTNIDSEQGARGLDLVTKTSVAAKSPNSILDALASGEVYMPQDQDFTLTEEVLQGAVSTTCVTEDGQNVIIIVAPPSPAHSNIYTSDTDPEWVPSPRQLCQPIQPSADHLQRVESCEEEVPAEEATHPPCGSLPPREEGEEEGAEQDGSLQVPREEEGRAEHRGRGARTSRHQEQGTQG